MNITMRRDGGLSRKLTRMYRAAARLPPRNTHKTKFPLVGRRLVLGHHRPVGTSGHRVGYPLNRKDGNWRGLHWQRRAGSKTAVGQYNSRLEHAERLRSVFPHARAPQEAACFSGNFPGDAMPHAVSILSPRSLRYSCGGGPTSNCGSDPILPSTRMGTRIELLISAISWLTAIGLIAAIIADVLR